MPRAPRPFALGVAALFLLPAIGASGSDGVRRGPPDSANRAQPGRSEPDVDRPLAWLIAAQNPDGSWGEEAQSKNPDVATTSLAGIALLRLGHTGSRGEFQANTRRAVEYVIGAVER